MTVDFGFVHQCMSICDMTGDGTITGARSGFSATSCPRDAQRRRVTDLAVLKDFTLADGSKLSDTEIIQCLSAALPNQDWAGTIGPGAGKPASGDCDGDGRTSGNDAAWCEAFLR
jgi:hypothetical protein